MPACDAGGDDRLAQRMTHPRHVNALPRGVDAHRDGAIHVADSQPVKLHAAGEGERCADGEDQFTLISKWGRQECLPHR